MMNSQFKIRNVNLRRLSCSKNNINQPWFIFILVYLSCTYHAMLVSTFIPNKAESSSHLVNQNQLMQNLPHEHQPSYEVESINTLNNNISFNINISSGSNNDNNSLDKIISKKGTPIIYPINELCYVDESLSKVLCQGLRAKKDLPKMEDYFETVQYAEFVNISKKADIRLEDLHNLFPNVVHLSINHSPNSLPSIIARNKGTKEFLTRNNNRTGGVQNSSGEQNVHYNKRARMFTTTARSSAKSFGDNYSNLYNNDDDNNETVSIGSGSGGGAKDRNALYYNANGNEFLWESVKCLNISWNELTSHSISNEILDVFPNLEILDVSHNFVSELKIAVDRVPFLKFMDISGNPLDCTSDLYWLEDHNIALLHSDQTLCDLPPHQNKAKPIWKVLRLIKKVREECKVNCTCDIAYIWEQNHVIHSKTSVNCSNRGFTDFPDPDKLPHPTDTLDLSNNQITSIKKFVEDERYIELHTMNLYLDNNKISSINLLEGCEWFYGFQVFTIRNNSITEVPVYVLENVFQHNKRILQIDLSMNSFNCECVTISTLKVWLLRYSSNIKHIDEVRCIETGESIRYMKREDWCKIEDGEALIDVLDILSIVLALAILLVIGKVYYDYYNFKTKGKLPWIVRKM